MLVTLWLWKFEKLAVSLKLTFRSSFCISLLSWIFCQISFSTSSDISMSSKSISEPSSKYIFVIFANFKFFEKMKVRLLKLFQTLYMISSASPKFKEFNEPVSWKIFSLPDALLDWSAKNDFFQSLARPKRFENKRSFWLEIINKW